MSPRGGYRALLQCEVWRERDRILARHEGGEREEDEGGEETEAGTAVLGLHYWSSSSSLSSNQRLPKEISEAVLDTGRLLVAGHSSILALDTNTLQAVGFLEFRDPIPSCVMPPLTVLPVATSSTMTTCPTDNQVYSVLNGMFEKTVSLLTLSLPPNKREKHSQEIYEQMLSFLSRAPLAPNSVLRSEFIPKPRPETTKPKQSTGPVGRKKNGGTSGGAVADKPLTFRNKVKSSGYTVPPRTKMFTPSTGGRSKTKTPAPPKTRERKLYPLERGAPAHVLCRLQPSSSPTSLTSLSFSGDGGYVSCGAADTAVYLLRLPPSQGKIQALTGHDGTVQSVDWSHSGDLLLTGSADRTAKLWTPTQKDPLLTISQSQSTSKLKSTAGGSGFPAAISRAVFYYLDKFLLLSSSNSLHLYKYHIHSQPTDDIKRYLNSSGYKLVQTLPMEKTQSITCMSCINEFLSHLVVVGGSNKSVDVIDMNVGRSVRYMGDCHTRPPHWAGLNKGSRGVAHPSWAYDLFLTAAPTDGVKLWDLRSDRCVRCLSAHVSRCHAVTAEFSPCSRHTSTTFEPCLLFTSFRAIRTL
ncbi:WD repeat-containing protein 27 [Geodia barretti]|uniref:WD repeat-containing protein 27 n=2 Tax=Geodia barretti TaxID=519541 RepID=A0AA35TJZ5_GEOBA|nr:WD repeat-containing protein 27 [Geodia barretti]